MDQASSQVMRTFVYDPGGERIPPDFARDCNSLQVSVFQRRQPFDKFGGFAILLRHVEPDEADWPRPETTPSCLIVIAISTGGTGGDIITRNDLHVGCPVIEYGWPASVVTAGAAIHEYCMDLASRLRQVISTKGQNATNDILETEARRILAEMHRERFGLKELIEYLNEEESKVPPNVGELPIGRENFVGAFRHSFVDNQIRLREMSFVANICLERKGKPYWEAFKKQAQPFLEKLVHYCSEFPKPHCLAFHLDKLPELAVAPDLKNRLERQFEGLFKAETGWGTGEAAEELKRLAQALQNAWKELDEVCSTEGPREVVEPRWEEFVKTAYALHEFFDRMPRHVLVGPLGKGND